MAKLPPATIRIRIFFAVLVVIYAAGLFATIYFSDTARVLSAIIFAVFGILWAFVAIHCYIRAEERGANPMLWGILVYLFPILGLLVYFLYFRGRKEAA